MIKKIIIIHKGDFKYEPDKSTSQNYGYIDYILGSDYSSSSLSRNDIEGIIRIGMNLIIEFEKKVLKLNKK